MSEQFTVHVVEDWQTSCAADHRHGGEEVPNSMYMQQIELKRVHNATTCGHQASASCRDRLGRVPIRHVDRDHLVATMGEPLRSLIETSRCDHDRFHSVRFPQNRDDAIEQRLDSTTCWKVSGHHVPDAETRFSSHDVRRR